ncbi:unnamed protein product [Oikopleura dioica]|uniref:PDZ domain-containing protein n=1 Tax=Oikopleura dioica TaxID=34765 RepID=E4X3Z0_OIKDI|nr:unnamed protein product [Oikopleura dioica]
MSRPFEANLQDKEASETIILDIVRRKGESWGIELCGEGPTEVRKIRPGGPADQAGLQTGDTILQCGGINVTRFGHQQVATIIAETDRLLRMKVLPDEGSSDESEEDDKDEDPTLKIKDKKFKSGEWWCDPENEKKLQEEKEKNKIDPYDFESFSENFDKIEKQHRKAGKNMELDSDEDSDDEYAKFMKMKQKMINKGLVSDDSDEDDENSEFAEFMRWKKQKRKAQRRGVDDWGDDNWADSAPRPVNARSSSGYSSYSSGSSRAVQGHDVAFRGQKIEQGQFMVTNKQLDQFDKNYVLGAENTFAGDKAAVAGAFTGDHNVVFNDNEGQAAGDIKGVRNRVAAGIMHFNYEDEQTEVREEDQDKVVIYSTSLGVNRELIANCQRAVAIIRSHRVRYEERDIFNFEHHKEGLWERLGLDRGDKFPPMPRIYIDGIYIGGISQLEALSDCGDLRIRLQHFSKFQERQHCQRCMGTGLLLCSKCNGKKKITSNELAELQCSQCDKNGNTECTDCVVMREIIDSAIMQ